MPPARDIMAHRGDDDGKSTSHDPLEYTLTVSRGVPCLQILAVSEPRHAISHQSRMLPQDVRVLRGPDLLLRPRELSCGGLSQDLAQEPVSQADIRGYQCGKGG